MDKILKEIADSYPSLNTVEAVVVAGSRTANQSDELSDYDIYVYCTNDPDIEFRTNLAKKYASLYEIDNRYFETGDEWLLKDGNNKFDFMFRNLDFAEAEIKYVFKEHNAKVGYTTCFLHNIATSQILFDKNGRFKALKEQLNEPYPNELKKNIIHKNLMLLSEKQNASYLEQISNAIKRDDIVSVNHRIAAFLASYFDIIIALNEKFHPGEKRLINFCIKNCSLLPQDFEKNIKALLNSKNNEKLDILANMIDELKKILP